MPLRAGRSVAVDPQSVPYGSAINGAVRVGYFWGSGDAAEQQSGRMKQPLRVWSLWPRP